MRVLKSRFMRVFLVVVLMLSFSLSLSYASTVPDEWTYIENPERIPFEDSYAIKTLADTGDTTYKLYYNTFARRASDGSYVSGSSLAKHWYNIPIEPVSFLSYNIRNYSYYEYFLSEVYAFKRSDNAIFGTSGMKLQLHIKDIMNQIQQGTTSNNAVNSTPINFDFSRIQQMVVKLYDAKDNVYSQTLQPSDVIKSGSKNGFYNLILDIESLPCDVRQVEIEFYYSVQYAFSGVNPNTNGFIYKNCGPGNTSTLDGTETTVDMFCRTDTSGFLSNIVDGITGIKDKIDEIFNLSGSESTTPLPDDSITDFESSSNDIRNDNDVSSSLDDVLNDADIVSFSNGFSVVWNLVERIYNTNPVFFTILTLVLSLGLVQLILNRR